MVLYLKSIGVLCKKNCLAINNEKLVFLPEENKYVNFQNFKSAINNIW